MKIQLLTIEALFAVSLATAGCRVSAESYCEAYLYPPDPVSLSVPEQYYVLPRSGDGSISLMLRYRDLSAPEVLDDGYDPRELADPTWSLDGSKFTALLQIYGLDLRRPSTEAELLESSPRLTAVVSDWPGWTKLKECATGCSQVFYINRDWSNNGGRHVLCYELARGSPLGLKCRAYDTIEGLHVAFSFPAVKKDHFEEFRERISTFIRQLIAKGNSECGPN